VSVVLDASALLVLLLDEAGADAVGPLLPDATMSAVNLAEVLSKLSDRGARPGALPRQLVAAGLRFEPVTEEDAQQVAELRQRDTQKLLSLGDRCCLALARRLGTPVLTADQAWSDIESGVDVVQVR
jgi:ribonuclease VapC